MAKYLFHVVGLRHHDFKDRLDELYARAEGNSMSLHIEEENVMEENAIIVYMADEFVGYVCSGERGVAEEVLRSGRNSELGKVVDIDREHRIITLEVNNDVKCECKGKERSNILREWHYDGELIRQAQEEVGLKAMMVNLQSCVEQQKEWNDNMTKYLDFIGKNLWRDAGVESQMQLLEIEHIMTANSDVVKGYKEAAAKLLFYITEVNSPEQRQRQVDYLYELSQSKEVRDMLNDMDEHKMQVVDSIPVALIRLFNSNPQEYVGRLRYLRCKYRQLRELQTLMAMRLALKSYCEPKNVESSDILVGGDETLENLSFAMNSFYKNSPKNLVLIYCVLRDNDLLVDVENYYGFVQLLVSKELLPWMTDKRMKSLSYTISGYMRDRIDHKKIRGSFDKNYQSWEDGKERRVCELIARFFKTE